MISIYKFKDGYYAVGEEGQKKSFIPSWEQVIQYFAIHDLPLPTPKLGDSTIRYINGTLEDYFSGKIRC